VYGDGDYLIIGLLINENTPGTFERPAAQVVSRDGSERLLFDIPCLCRNGVCTEFPVEEEKSIGGCVIIVPYLTQDGGGSEAGGAFYVSGS